MRMIPALSVNLLLLSGALCPAQEPKAIPGAITTTGSATIQVQPDSVRVTFGHQIRLAGLKEARAESEKQVKRISDALQALKIDALKIATAAESLQVIMSTNPAAAAPVADMPLVPIGYQVRTSFTVTAKSKDLDKLRDIAKRLTDAAVENGANLGPSGNSPFRDDLFGGGGGGPFGGPRTISRSFMPGVEIFKEDMAEARKQAISAAVKNALATAEALANGANTKVRKINAISDDVETPARVEPNDSYESSIFSILGNPRQDVPIVSRTVTSITVRVRITCSFE